MLEYAIPILVFVILGIAAGVILTIASKALEVKTDETVEKVLGDLPGINCGACGFSGCEGYAVAVAAGDTPLTLCKPGGEKTAKALGDIMGVSVGDVEREVAYVHCNGNCDAVDSKYVFNGTGTCAAVTKFYNGIGNCRYGCMGLGDCKDACEYDAINMVNGIAVIDPAKCVSCGLCVKECPNHIITLRKISQKVNVACSSRDTGKVVTKTCKNGCIACKICEKKCPEDAIHVVDNLAVIDPDKCTNCGICVAACPKKCIHELAVCEK